MTSIKSLLVNADTILGVRDRVGAALKEVFIVTRTWTGDEVGAGQSEDQKDRMLPSPRIVEFTNDVRLNEGGQIKRDDILLKMISKQKYPTENLIDCVSNKKHIEKFYEVGGIRYSVIGVTEKHITWNVLLRRTSKQ